jgi:hypothetical protein
MKTLRTLHKEVYVIWHHQISTHSDMYSSRARRAYCRKAACATAIGSIFFRGRVRKVTKKAVHRRPGKHAPTGDGVL